MKPVLQALILADQIYVDRTTGKKVIAGTFHRLWSSHFPVNFERATWAYISLTEVVDVARVSLAYVDLSNHQVLMKTPHVELKSSSPLQTVDFVCPVPPFPMLHAGVYAFEAYVDDELLGSLRITVNQIETGDKP